MNARVQGRWAEIDLLLDQVLDLTPAERPAFLTRVRSEDPELEGEIERILVAITSAEEFLQECAPTYASPLIKRLFDQDELAPGTRLGAYEIIRELGQGGTATVYLAHDLKHHRQVAVKVLHAHLAAAVGADRFLREIEIAATLHHPHILPLFDSGSAEGLLYYVMPHVEGESLRQLMANGLLPVSEVIRIGQEVASALEHAHRRGVVHRDIKPENILLQDGQAIVADFGIARAVDAAGDDGATERIFATGTPSYMSPEQATGLGRVDGRTDIYALGCVLYELLAGHPPFTGSTVHAVLASHVEDTVPSLITRGPALPERLERAIYRALAKNPEDRFPTARAFGDELSRADPAAGASLTVARWVTIGVAGIAVLLTIALAGTAGSGDLQSVAVLPLVNVGDRLEDEYFAAGMTDELTSALGKVPGLRVAARTSAFTFEGRGADAREVGARLGVAHLLEGSVRRAGARVRVALQLVSAADGLTRWSHSFESASGDVFAVQDSITRAVVVALDLTLGRAELSSIGAGRTLDPEAHDLYLRGLYASHLLTEEGLRRALEYARQALARDPGYASAYSLIALTYTGLADVYMTPREAYAQAKAAAERALALDSLVADAHLALGSALFALDLNFDGAEREFRTALALAPNSAEVRWVYGGAYLCAIGKWREGLIHVDGAIQLDPLGALPSWEREYCLYAGRQYDSVILQNRRTRQLDPNLLYWDSWVGAAYREKGLIRQALAEYERAQSIAGDRPLYGRAITLDRAGQVGEARGVVRALKAEAQRGRATAYFVALAYAGLGERDSAFAWLDRSVGARETPGGAYFPEFDRIRADPRFAQWLRRVGLPPPQP